MSIETAPAEPQTSASDALIDLVKEALAASAQAAHAAADAHDKLLAALREEAAFPAARRRAPLLRLRKRS